MRDVGLWVALLLIAAAVTIAAVSAFGQTPPPWGSLVARYPSPPVGRPRASTSSVTRSCTRARIWRRVALLFCRTPAWSSSMGAFRR